MGDPARKRMTVDEFLAWDDGTDRRYELVAGEIVAMAPVSDVHAVIAGNLAVEIGSRLRPPCRVRIEAGIKLPDRDDTFYEADLAISCTPPSIGVIGAPDPVVIVEILSPSTATRDRGGKVPDYRTIPSVQEIVLVSTAARRVEVWRRTNGRWIVQDLVGDAVLHLDSIAVELPLGAIYDGIPL